MKGAALSLSVHNDGPWKGFSNHSFGKGAIREIGASVWYGAVDSDAGAYGRACVSRWKEKHV